MPVDSRLSVLFAVQHDIQAPGSRYRVFQYLPHLRLAGFDCTVLRMQGAASTRRSIRASTVGGARRAAHFGLQLAEAVWLSARLLRDARGFDRLYLYRIPLLRPFANALRRHQPRILFDLDDAWDAPEREGLALARLRERVLTGSYRRAVRIASVVVVSNARNQQVVTGMGGRAVVVPTVVDVERYRFRDRAEGPTDGTPVIGWIGTPSTARYLPAIEAVLARAVEQSGAIVRLVGSGGNPFRTVQADVREWSIATESSQIDSFDIGVMPMPDTAWTRGKAALKALQYGASGAPTVASWTSTNEEILGRSAGVVLCRSEREWTLHLEALLADPLRRSQVGKRGRELVERKYSVQVQAPRLISVIRDVQSSSRENSTGEVAR